MRKKIEGKSYQEKEPTPENPVEIKNIEFFTAWIDGQKIEIPIDDKIKRLKRFEKINGRWYAVYGPKQIKVEFDLEESLIKENEYLKEQLSEYKRINNLVKNITPEEVDAAIKRASEQFIEVSKVEKELIQLNKDEKKELKGMKGQDRYFVKQQYAAKREILEKVLKMRGR